MPITPELGSSLLQACLSKGFISSTRSSATSQKDISSTLPPSDILLHSTRCSKPERKPSSLDDSVLTDVDIAVPETVRDAWRPLRRRGAMLYGHTVDALCTKVFNLYKSTTGDEDTEFWCVWRTAKLMQDGTLPIPSSFPKRVFACLHYTYHFVLLISSGALLYVSLTAFVE